VAEREDVGEADGLTFLEMSWRFERAMAERPRFSALAEGSLEGSGVLSRETSAGDILVAVWDCVGALELELGIGGAEGGALCANVIQSLRLQ
jgi:hypothetical protein